MPVKSYTYKTRFPVLIYEAVRDGKGVTKLCREMGWNRQTFANWKKKFPAVRFAVKRGKLAKDNMVGRQNIDFGKYVFGRLPRDLQAVWSDLGLDKPLANMRPNRTRRAVDALSKTEKQVLFVHAYVENDFNAAAASRVVMVSYSAYEKWKREDRKFKMLLASVHQMKQDYVEGGLFKKIKEGDINAILFASRTLNADRGYDPKNTTILRHEGQVIHEHKHTITLDQVINALPIQAKRDVLAVVRQLKDAAEKESVQLPEHVEDADYLEVEDK